MNCPMINFILFTRVVVSELLLMPNSDNSKKSIYTLCKAIKRNIVAVHEERHVQPFTISCFCLNDRYNIFIICTIIPVSAFPGSRLFVI